LPFPGTAQICKIIKKFRPHSSPGLDTFCAARFKTNIPLMAGFFSTFVGVDVE